MEYKLQKYSHKLHSLQNIFYYFNTYGKPVPEKYTKLINILTSEFSYIKEATPEEHLQIRIQANTICKDDYVSRLKLNIGYFDTVFTFFVLNSSGVESVMNIVITNNNSCYIITYCGFTPILLDTLKNICKKYGLVNIHTFSTYQPESDYLLKNKFIKDKNRYLIYEL